MEKEMRIEAYRSHELPDLEILARYLLPKIQKAAQDPEVQRKYREWQEAGGYEGWKQRQEEARRKQQ